MGASLNFIEIWLKLLEEKYKVRCGIYNKAKKYMFKQIPTKITKALIPKKSPETYDRN